MALHRSLLLATVVSSLAFAVGCGGGVDVEDFSDGGDDTADDAGAESAPLDARPDSAVDARDAADSAASDTALDASEDTAIDGDLDTGAPDTGAPDTGPKDCSSVALAVDPASSLDPLADGPLKVAKVTVTVPTLGPLSSAKVKIHYPVLADGVTPHPGRHAWVMFHHAVHGPYPGVTYDRYDGIFDRWASHGIITFSIDGSSIFFPPPPCGPGTAASGSGCYTYQTYDQLKVVGGVMDDAISYFLKTQEDATFALHCALDPNRVGVAGHSRGGGAALLVNTARTDGANVKAYIGFQPVDPEFAPGAPTPPSKVPMFDRPALWLDSGNDGDVTYPNTAMIYADTRGKASHVTILGSKHTFTLDTPYPDQGGPTATITPDEHRRVCQYYAVPFLRAYVRDAAPAAKDLDIVAGPGGLSVASTVSSGDATLRFRPENAYSAWIEKFDEALGTTPSTTVAGDTLTLAGSMTAVSYETYVTSTSGGSAIKIAVSKLLRSVKLNWGTTEGALEVPLPSLAGKKAIVFETSFLDSPSATSGNHPLYLELVDTTGARASLSIDSLVPVSWGKRPRRLSTVYVPFTKFTGVDPTKAKSIRFVAKAGTTNHDILVDLLRVE